MRFHPDVLAAHAEFGGDLEDMQRRYDAPDALSGQQAIIEDNERLLAGVREAEQFVSAFAGENVPAREWAVRLTKTLRAALHSASKQGA